MFPDVEVVSLDPLLGVLDRLGDHNVLYLLPLRHPQPFHESGDPLGTENTHEIVLKAQEESGTARVTLTTGPSPELVVDPPALMALGSEDVQTPRLQDRGAFLFAKLHHFLMDLPVLLGIGVLDLVPGEKDRVSPQDDIGPSSRHVGRHGHSAGPPRLGHNISFTFVVLGVENVVADALPLHHPRQEFRTFDGGGTHKDRLSPMLAVGYFLDHGTVFLLHGTIDDVRVVVTDHRLVGGDHSHIQVVDVLELGRLRVRCPCHTRQFGIHPEVVLEGDGSESLVLALDPDPLFSLQGLVQTVAVTSPRHEAASELVDDENLVVLDDIIHIPLEKSVGLESLLNVVVDLDGRRVIEVLDAQELFNTLDTLFGENNAPGLLVLRIVHFLF